MAVIDQGIDPRLEIGEPLGVRQTALEDRFLHTCPHPLEYLDHPLPHPVVADVEAHEDVHGRFASRCHGMENGW